MKMLMAAAALFLIAACTTAPGTAPADLFMASLARQCGKAFEGRIVSAPVAADAAFAGKRLVMHVRECRGDTIRVPFHVGDDRSRTWVVTRTAAGVRLKHDHRHEDGSEDVLTQYGGDSAGSGGAVRQEFPADAFSKALFVARGSAQSVPNVWAMEVNGAIFAYELRRPGRHFRVEFDLTRPVALPPPPWGAEVSRR